MSIRQIRLSNQAKDQLIHSRPSKGLVRRTKLRLNQEFARVGEFPGRVLRFRTIMTKAWSSHE